MIEPTYEFEAELHASGSRYVIGCDEVGRGAIAGPVAVGMVVVDSSVGPAPVGLRDSKLLSEAQREMLAPLCSQWVVRSAVGLAGADEVDEFGIIEGLARAGSRAFAALVADGGAFDAASIILDGKHDWLSPVLGGGPPVVMRIKADQTCASVSAASVIAKVHRDHIMIEHDAVIPGYGWSRNKGYASAAHFAAIDELGVSDFHRRTWLKQAA